MVSTPSFVIMGLESSHIAFQGKAMGPPAHWLEEKSSGTSIMEMQNTQWCCGTMWGHFIHTVPLSPSSECGGVREEAAVHEEDGVMWESSGLLHRLIFSPQLSFVQQVVLWYLYVESCYLLPEAVRITHFIVVWLSVLTWLWKTNGFKKNNPK